MEEDAGHTHTHTQPSADFCCLVALPAHHSCADLAVNADLRLSHADAADGSEAAGGGSWKRGGGQERMSKTGDALFQSNNICCIVIRSAAARWSSVRALETRVRMRKAVRDG
jgi:hypothetical protein